MHRLRAASVIVKRNLKPTDRNVTEMTPTPSEALGARLATIIILQFVRDQREGGALRVQLRNFVNSAKNRLEVTP
jgi:hypothetical protein